LIACASYSEFVYVADVGINMTSQFHDFFNLIFGGFSVVVAPLCIPVSVNKKDTVTDVFKNYESFHSFARLYKRNFNIIIFWNLPANQSYPFGKFVVI
jgi:hypothetical protein